MSTIYKYVTVIIVNITAIYPDFFGAFFLHPNFFINLVWLLKQFNCVLSRLINPIVTIDIIMNWVIIIYFENVKYYCLNLKNKIIIYLYFLLLAIISQK